MRARWIKPEFFSDRKIAALGPIAALVYAALWVMADDYGTAPCDPDRIKGSLFFGWTAVGLPEISAALQGLLDSSRIRVFRDGDDLWCTISTWKKHQKVHNPSAHTNPVKGEAVTQITAEILGSPPKILGSPHILDSYTPRLLDTSSHSANGAEREVPSVATHVEPRADLPPKRRRKSDAPGNLGSWPATATEILAEHVGVFAIGRVGRKLKPVVDRIGERWTFSALRNFGENYAVMLPRSRAPTPEAFAERYREFLPADWTPETQAPEFVATPTPAAPPPAP